MIPFAVCRERILCSTGKLLLVLGLYAKGVIALAGTLENASRSPTLSYDFGPIIRDNSDSAGTQMTQCAILSGPVMSSALYLSETDII
jgi:hypothetical protein